MLVLLVAVAADQQNLLNNNMKNINNCHLMKVAIKRLFFKEALTLFIVMRHANMQIQNNKRQEYWGIVGVIAFLLY